MIFHEVKKARLYRLAQFFLCLDARTISRVFKRFGYDQLSIAFIMRHPHVPVHIALRICDNSGLTPEEFMNLFLLEIHDLELTNVINHLTTLFYETTTPNV